jgi:Fe-S-cluster-containing dehydrogenase component
MVRISQDCIVCGVCVKYCPVAAICIPDDGVRAVVDLDACVECGTCSRATVCPVDAIVYPPLPYPRSLRRLFSDPTSRHVVTGVPGRGTEEVKTNDVTDRFKAGEVGVCVEVGRPGIGTSLGEVEKITRVLARHAVVYEARNPVTQLLADPSTGALKREVLGESVLSIILEFVVAGERLAAIVRALDGVADDLTTVFSLSVISRLRDDGSIPVRAVLDTAGFQARPNAKINLGLGRS